MKPLSPRQIAAEAKRKVLESGCPLEVYGPRLCHKLLELTRDLSAEEKGAAFREAGLELSRVPKVLLHGHEASYQGGAPVPSKQEQPSNSQDRDSESLTRDFGPQALSVAISERVLASCKKSAVIERLQNRWKHLSTDERRDFDLPIFGHGTDLLLLRVTASDLGISVFLPEEITKDKPVLNSSTHALGASSVGCEIVASVTGGRSAYAVQLDWTYREGRAERKSTLSLSEKTLGEAGSLLAEAQQFVGEKRAALEPLEKDVTQVRAEETIAPREVLALESESLRAVVFEQSGERGPLYSVKLEGHYREQGGAEERSTITLPERALPSALGLLSEAERTLSERRQEILPPPAGQRKKQSR